MAKVIVKTLIITVDFFLFVSEKLTITVVGRGIPAARPQAETVPLCLICVDKQVTSLTNVSIIFIFVAIGFHKVLLLERIRDGGEQLTITSGRILASTFPPQASTAPA